MDSVTRTLLQTNESGDTTAPFFGFIGAASALVFACERPLRCWSVDLVLLRCRKSLSRLGAPGQP
jgi:hypothetical protein